MRSFLKNLLSQIFPSPPPRPEFKALEEYDGSERELLQAALPFIPNDRYHAPDCKFEIFEDREGFVVSVIHRDAVLAPGQRGSPPGFPIFSVVLDKTTRRFIRSQYNR